MSISPVRLEHTVLFVGHPDSSLRFHTAAVEGTQT